MEEILVMTGLFVAGAGAGALVTYFRDRNLLRLYGDLVQDLSSMISRTSPHPTDGPATTARIPHVRQRAS